MVNINSIKVAGIGAFGAVTTGLILAVYQVQGLKMPTALAVLLLVILFGLLGLSIGLLFLAAIKAVKQIVEQRATSATWVSSEAPGLLDCEVDGKRAAGRLKKELGRLQVDMNKLDTLEKFIKQINDMGNKKAKTKQQRANRIGKKIDRRAVYIEKRTGLFKTLTKEIVRNYEVMIATLNVTDEKDKLTAKYLIYAFDSFDSAGTAVIKGVASYKQAAELLRQTNLTKKIREASKRLINSLDSMLSCFIQFQDNCHHMHTELEQKCANMGSSIPDTEGSQP